MAACCRLGLLALVAWLGVAVAVPVRNDADCVDNNLVRAVGSVYPSTHQIQRALIQERTTVTLAQNFEITYGNTYKIVNISRNDISETYVLYQCGTGAPNPVELGLPAATKAFSVPLRAVNAPDTTVLGFLKLLGVQDRVSYVTSNAVDSCMQLLSSPQCGSRSSSKVDSTAIDGSFDFYKNANNPTSIMFRATADLGPLHDAEYIKYLATFFNREAIANRRFTEIFNSYNDLSADVLTYMSANNIIGPVVAWVYYQSAYDPDPEQIQIKFHSYRAQYTLDAGGRLPDLEMLRTTFVNGQNVQVNDKGDLVLTNLNTSETTAAMRGILASVDIVIDESWAPDLTSYTVDSFLGKYLLNYSTATADFQFLRNQKVLRLDATASSLGFTAWLEEAVARPDLVLHDLVAFISPAVLQANRDIIAPHLVRNLFPTTTTTTTTSALNAAAGNSTRDSTTGLTIVTAGNCILRQQCGSAPKPICPAVYLDCSGKLVTVPEGADTCPSTCLSQSGGAAGARATSPLLPLLSLLAVVMAAVMGPCRW